MVDELVQRDWHVGKESGKVVRGRTLDCSVISAAK